MSEKERFEPKVQVTSGGAVYVDVEHLFTNPKVQKFIRDMAGIQNNSQNAQPNKTVFSQD